MSTMVLNDDSTITVFLNYLDGWIVQRFHNLHHKSKLQTCNSTTTITDLYLALVESKEKIILHHDDEKYNLTWGHMCATSCWVCAITPSVSSLLYLSVFVCNPEREHIPVWLQVTGGSSDPRGGGEVTASHCCPLPAVPGHRRHTQTHSYSGDDTFRE